MKKHTTLLLLALFLSPLSAFAAPRGPVLEPLKDKDYESGCGCSVWNARRQIVLFSDLEEKAPATVRVDGQLEKLKFVKTTKANTNPKLNERFSQEYEKGSVNLKLDYKTTFVCGPKDESCEVTKYDVKALITDGKRKTELRGLKGDCGC